MYDMDNSLWSSSSSHLYLSSVKLYLMVLILYVCESDPRIREVLSVLITDFYGTLVNVFFLAFLFFYMYSFLYSRSDAAVVTCSLTTPMPCLCHTIIFWDYKLLRYEFALSVYVIICMSFPDPLWGFFLNGEYTEAINN